MKKILPFFLMIICFTIGHAQDWKSEPFTVKSISGQNISQVLVETSGGNITVKQDAKERVEVFVQPNNYKMGSNISRQELEKRLNEYYDFELTTGNNSLRAIAKPRNNMRDWNRAVSVSFVVYVSSNVSTKLTTSGGNITLYGLNGSQNFTTSGGNLNLEKLKGTIKGRTSGGNITLKDLSDNIDLTTSGGNITAENCRGIIELHTSGGSVSLNGLDGKINARTSGGNVKGSTIKGELTAHTSGGNVSLEGLRSAVNASTSGGNIRLEIIELAGAVKASNSSGSVDIALPGGKGMDLDLRASRVKADHLTNFSGKVEEDEVQGKLNGGGIPVIVKAGSGRISLSFK